MIDVDTPPAGMTVDLGGLGSVPTERLEAEICALAAHLAAGEHRWLRLIGEYEARRGYETWGMSSAVTWLSWQCGLSPHAARERVRVATALRALPLIDAAFAAGQLTYSKVRALVRVADEPTETMFVEMARHATASQLERLLAGYRRALTPTPPQPSEPQRRPEFWFSWHHDDTGALIISGRLAPEDGAILLAALRHHDHHTTPTADHGADGDVGLPTRAERAATTLVDLAANSLATPTSDTGGDEYRVCIDINLDTLIPGTPGDTPTSRLAKLKSGYVSDPDTARRLTCDNVLTRVVTADSTIIDVGTATRTIPRGLRRLLQRRDQHCQFPGCDRPHQLHAHHIVHWTDHGPTRPDNLILVCRYHHRLLHEHHYTITGNPTTGQLTWRRPDNTILPTRPPSPPPGQPVHLPLLANTRDLAQRVAGPSGDPLHLDYAVHAYVNGAIYQRTHHTTTTRGSAEPPAPDNTTTTPASPRSRYGPT